MENKSVYLGKPHILGINTFLQILNESDNLINIEVNSPC